MLWSGKSTTQVKAALLRDHSCPARGAFTCIRSIPLSCTGPEKSRGGVVMYMCMCVCMYAADISSISPLWMLPLCHDEGLKLFTLVIRFETKILCLTSLMM